MLKIGEFIYPWGSGHYSRMMRLNEVLGDYIKEEFEVHFSSKDHVYEKLLKKFPDEKEKIHEILMPTPIDGKFGPSVTMSLMNLLLPISKNPPLVRQIANYLREERKLYNKEKFDLVINDGDMGSNILAKNRNIPSLFITNQFRPKLYSSRSYLYPSLIFVAKQIQKASKILVADSPPPYTMCEYNLNFIKEAEDKVTYVGHFTNSKKINKIESSDLEKLIENNEFGYWMRTGNKSTNDGTGQRYEEVFCKDEMKTEKRIISHARNDPKIDSVLGKDGKKYSISDALEKKIDWIQIDVGFLSEQEKDTVLDSCKYAVVNGSHTVMGEIMGGKAKPIIGIPIYDEHTNNIKWAEEKNLGILATKAKQVIEGISKIRENYERFEENLDEFSKNFVPNGAENSAKIAAQTLEEKR
ncbi:Glycosyl transferase protein [Marine Group I thaumarchaeote SCGC AAA799-N04]|uniref:Glycosyl transferase protein n=1 Tax=Marine Group I thaumarchaeote SCGC AAA799-N04 TaxID=1502293 RepID=A0A081RQ98_9ARCH|nr:Glycosyl transferase protein [Marine Group I thaumarchaeote SCGC AAA799-N04]